MSAGNTTPENKGPSEEPQASEWVCRIIAAEGVIGVLGNLLVCYVILRVKFLHNMTNFLLVKLAVADMLLCLLAVILYLVADPNCRSVHYIPGSTGEKVLFCQFLASGFLTWALSYVASYTLCLVTLERYVAIVHPLQYGRRLTSTTNTCMTALIWITGFIFALPFLFTTGPSEDPNKACSEVKYPNKSFPILVGIFSFLFAFLVPIIFMCWAYYTIQVTLKRQAQALNLRQARAAAYDLVVARQRLVNMLTIILGMLIVLWTPAYTVVLICLQPTQEENTALFICSSQTFTLVKGIFNCFFYLNSVINPIIYEFKYKKFKQGFKVAFCGCFSKQGNNRIDTEMALAHLEDRHDV